MFYFIVLYNEIKQRNIFFFRVSSHFIIYLATDSNQLIPIWIELDWTINTRWIKKNIFSKVEQRKEIYKFIHKVATF